MGLIFIRMGLTFISNKISSLPLNNILFKIYVLSN